MGRLKGSKRTPEDIARQLATKVRNFIATKPPDEDFRYGTVHWQRAERRHHGGRLRLALPITCKLCGRTGWRSLDNARKQARKSHFTAACISCHAKLTWAERGRPRPEVRRLNSNGYRKVYRPEHPDADKRGELYEHRLVMEGIVGRRLQRHEHVHHRNGDKTDNRPENLELLPGRTHRQLEALIARVKQLEAFIRSHGLQPPR